MTDLYPLLFEPALKDYVWGGRNLETRLGRRLPPGKVAESWEISAHPDGQAIVANGRFAGLMLSVLHERLGLDLIGRNSAWAQERGKFPLLIKLLDAQERLSVQVHPGDAYAQANEGGELGKTEMWVVLHADPDAAVILGVTRGTTPDAFRKALEANQLEPLLHKVSLQEGDFVCVPSGSIHAILGGLLIAEIQQTSNVTYRVYDWGRKAANRPLHIKEALEVSNFNQIEPEKPQARPLAAQDDWQRELLCRNRYFTVERWRLAAGGQYEGYCDGSTMEIWGVLKGSIGIRGGTGAEDVESVRFALLPAALGAFTLKADEPAVLLRAYVEAQ